MKLVGTQLQFAIGVLRARAHPVDAGASNKELEERLKLAGQFTKLIMQATVSVIVMLACFYLIYKGASPSAQKGCFAMLGSVVGYWLR